MAKAPERTGAPTRWISIHLAALFAFVLAAFVAGFALGHETAGVPARKNVRVAAAPCAYRLEVHPVTGERLDTD